MEERFGGHKSIVKKAKAAVEKIKYEREALRQHLRNVKVDGEAGEIEIVTKFLKDADTAVKYAEGLVESIGDERSKSVAQEDLESLEAIVDEQREFAAAAYLLSKEITHRVREAQAKKPAEYSAEQLKILAEEAELEAVKGYTTTSPRTDLPTAPAPKSTGGSYRIGDLAVAIAEEKQRSDLEDAEVAIAEELERLGSDGKGMTMGQILESGEKYEADRDAEKEADRKMEAARNKDTPPDELKKMALEESDHALCRYLAANKATPPDALEALAKHGDSGVRYRVAQHSATPDAVLIHLSSGGDNIALEARKNAMRRRATHGENPTPPTPPSPAAAVAPKPVNRLENAIAASEARASNPPTPKGNPTSHGKYSPGCETENCRGKKCQEP